MPRFFLQRKNISDGIVTIQGDDARHISRSLRMRPGEHITVCDMQKRVYDCVLEEFTPDTVRAKVVAESESETEPPVFIKLYQALPKSDKLDTIIQKAVESGASEIIPFESERCVVRIEPSKEDKKLERRSRIALEAAKQCGRGIIPAVRAPLTFEKILTDADDCQLKLFFYEGDGTVSLREVLEEIPSGVLPEKVAAVIGSEGGFSLCEVERAKKAGFVICGLGKRILRCETAPGFVLACLAYRFEL